VRLVGFAFRGILRALRARPRVAAALAIGPFLLGSAAWSQSGVEDLIRGLQKRYASVTSVSADFEQTYRAPGIVQTESGTLYMKKPGLMRWEYRTPEEKLFVADGRDTYLYVPEDRQVLVRRYTSEELQSTPLQFLLGRGRILESFEVSAEVEIQARIEGTALMRLVPRQSDPGYAWMAIEFDERTFDLRRLVIREHTGNTSEFFLTNVRTNIRMDSRQFSFKIPKGVEVIHMDEK